MTYPFGETITRQRGVATDDPYANEDDTDLDWTNPSELEIGGWGVDDSRSVEPLEDGRSPVITDYVLYRDEPADVLAGDRVVVRGVTCDVVGRPATWRNPLTGTEAGFVVRAKLPEG